MDKPAIHHSRIANIQPRHGTTGRFACESERYIQAPGCLIFNAAFRMDTYVPDGKIDVRGLTA